LLQGYHGDSIESAFDLSIQRTISDVRRVRSSWWNIVYAIYATKIKTGDAPLHPSLIEDAIWTLQTWPIEQIYWPVDNSKRLDVRMDIDPDRSFNPQLRTLVPWDENCMFRWNASPYTYGRTHTWCHARQ
jgi:hypothetical protein